MFALPPHAPPHAVDFVGATVALDHKADRAREALRRVRDAPREAEDVALRNAHRLAAPVLHSLQHHRARELEEDFL